MRVWLSPFSLPLPANSNVMGMIPRGMRRGGVVAPKRRKIDVGVDSLRMMGALADDREMNDFGEIMSPVGISAGGDGTGAMGTGAAKAAASSADATGQVRKGCRLVVLRRASLAPHITTAVPSSE